MQGEERSVSLSENDHELQLQFVDPQIIHLWGSKIILQKHDQKIIAPLSSSSEQWALLHNILEAVEPYLKREVVLD